jgi:hypothetical protein
MGIGTLTLALSAVPTVLPATASGPLPAPDSTIGARAVDSELLGFQLELNLKSSSTVTDREVLRVWTSTSARLREYIPLASVSWGHRERERDE